MSPTKKRLLQIIATISEEEAERLLQEATKDQSYSFKDQFRYTSEGEVRPSPEDFCYRYSYEKTQ